MQLFLDLDGVLADFDRFYAEQFGVVLTRSGAEPPDLWRNIDAYGTFFEDLPMTPDADVLWAGACRLHASPIILSGVPRSVLGVEAQKRAWVAQHFGPEVRIICCRAREKYLHGTTGDILVDDWARYQARWEGMGGHFILHRTAEASLAEIDALTARHASQMPS